MVALTGLLRYFLCFLSQLNDNGVTFSGEKGDGADLWSEIRMWQLLNIGWEADLHTLV